MLWDPKLGYPWASSHALDQLTRAYGMRTPCVGGAARAFSQPAQIGGPAVDWLSHATPLGDAWRAASHLPTGPVSGQLQFLDAVARLADVRVPSEQDVFAVRCLVVQLTEGPTPAHWTWRFQWSKKFLQPWIQDNSRRSVISSFFCADSNAEEN